MSNSDTRNLIASRSAYSGFGTSTIFVGLMLINTTGVSSPLTNDSLNSCEMMGAIIQNGTRTLKPSQFSQGRIQENIKLLNSFRTLQHGWDGYQGLPPSVELIDKTIDILTKIEFQPRIFPTPDATLQLEFTSATGDELDIEIGENFIEYFKPHSAEVGSVHNSLQLNHLINGLFA